MAGFDPSQPRGPDGKWVKKPARLLCAAGLAVLVFTATPSVTTTGLATGGGAISAESSIGQLTRGALNKAKRSAQKGHRRTTWKRLKLREQRREVRRASQCAANSHGDVQRFFLRTPCRSLTRVLYSLDGHGGDRVVVSVSWVRMRSGAAARSLKDLVDVHGTGDITPLPGALVGAGHIHWGGWNYGSRRSGRVVTIAEAEPLRGNPSAAFLDGVAEAAALLPSPR